MTKQVAVSVWLVAALAASGPGALAVEIDFTPTGMIDTYVGGMSDDGSIIAGGDFFGFGGNWSWSPATGGVPLGGGCPSGQVAISGNGDTIVGCHIDDDELWNAALWLGGLEWQDLGSEPGATNCDAFLSGSHGLDHHGNLVVGLLWLAEKCRASAGTWNLSTGEVTALAKLIPDRSSRANAVSGDGSVIVGWQDLDDGFRQGAQWDDGIPAFIYDDLGRPVGEAHATNHDGSVIVGSGYGSVDGDSFAWRWKDGVGMKPIGTAPPFALGGDVATDTSDDGSIVVGFLRYPDGAMRGWFWREEDGLRFMDDYLEEMRVEAATGWEILSVSAVSADGRTMAGTGLNPAGLIESWHLMHHPRPRGCHQSRRLRAKLPCPKV
jgi:uncharacterized membrane protein